MSINFGGDYQTIRRWGFLFVFEKKMPIQLRGLKMLEKFENSTSRIENAVGMFLFAFENSNYIWEFFEKHFSPNSNFIWELQLLKASEQSRQFNC